MNILLYNHGSDMHKDIVFFLQQLGYHCKSIFCNSEDTFQGSSFEHIFSHSLEENHWDCVVSINFFPLVAQICYKHHIKYLSWVCDFPFLLEPAEALQYPTSYIFLFDRMEVDRIKQLGGVNLFYLPFAVSTARADSIQVSAEDISRFHADISFVGQFWDSPLNQWMSCQSEYDKGYVDAIVQTQMKVYGFHFIEETVTEELVNRMNQCLSLANTPFRPLNIQDVVSSISTQVTQMERLILCNMFGELYNFKYYSDMQPSSLSNLHYGGIAQYDTDMPKIFRLSKINFSPISRDIQSGIPFRALDILSCKGVLLSNYQPELAEYFIDGEELILYESLEDAVCKADYYLKHDDLRESMAQKAYQKIKTHFNYPDRIQKMFQTAGLI